jgi:hypothetical protein
LHEEDYIIASATLIANIEKQCNPNTAFQPSLLQTGAGKELAATTDSVLNGGLMVASDSQKPAKGVSFIQSASALHNRNGFTPVPLAEEQPAM